MRLPEEAKSILSPLSDLAHKYHSKIIKEATLDP
jgi:predicted DNA-binding protein